MGRLYSPDVVLTLAAITRPSGPEKVEVTRPSGQRFQCSNDGFKIKTKSFFARLTVRRVHLLVSGPSEGVAK